MKRTIAWSLVLVMVFGVLPMVSAAAMPEFQITVSEDKSENGTVLEVAVATQTNADLYALGFYLSYPADKVMLVETAAELDDNSIRFGDGKKAVYPLLAVTAGQINYGANAQNAFSVNAGHAFFVAHFTVKSGASGNAVFALKDLNFVYDGGSKTYGAGDVFPSAKYAISSASEEITTSPVVAPTLTVSETPEEKQQEQQPTATFTDVKATDWFAPWVDKAVDKGLFKGNADGTFHPNDPITRAQFVTVLWRMAGKPAPKASSSFADVVGESEEFRNAIAWAHENGVVNGTSETAFSPRGALTREAAMTILYRLNGSKSGMETLMTSIYDDNFTDSANVSSWAKAALYWGVYSEILSGTSATTLSPQMTATRAQIAKILVGYDEKG